MSCFTDLATVKTALSIPTADTTHDLKIQAMVDAVNSSFLKFFYLDDCGPTQYTNYYDVVDEVSAFWLQQYPVISVQSVEVDGALQDADTYYLDARMGDFGQLKRKYGGSVATPGYWPVGPRVLKVVHTAGWAGGTPDDDLQRAATLAVIYDFNTGDRTGFQGERIGQYSYTTENATTGSGFYGGAAAGSWPAPVSRVLSQWYRPFAEGG